MCPTEHYGLHYLVPEASNTELQPLGHENLLLHTCTRVLASIKFTVYSTVPTWTLRIHEHTHVFTKKNIGIILKILPNMSRLQLLHKLSIPGTYNICIRDNTFKVAPPTWRNIDQRGKYRRIDASSFFDIISPL